MDMTGTLTRGEPEVTDVLTESLPGGADGQEGEVVGEDRLLSLAAAVERESEHPLARAVVAHADGRGLPRLQAVGFASTPGHGAAADVDGHRVVVGNRALMSTQGVQIADLGRRQDEIVAAWRTAVMVAVDGRVAGVIGIADAPRDTARAAVQTLHAAGIKVVMLTGDNQVGYNTIALPIAAGVFEPAFGLVLRPEIAALSMSGSSLLVAANALHLKRLRLA